MDSVHFKPYDWSQVSRRCPWGFYAISKLDQPVAMQPEKLNGLINLTVCVNNVQQNIKCGIKGDKYFVDEVETQLREKPLRGSQT